jgi:uncharacterized OB-fold protein
MNVNGTLPVPRPSKETQPFWEAARERRLVMPRCDECGRYTFPPSLACPYCGRGELRWVEVSGRGRVFSYVVFHRVYHPAFRDRVPYVVAVIALDEGPRLLSNVVGVPAERVECEMRVRAVFDDVRDGMVIPQFTPEEAT